MRNLLQTINVDKWDIKARGANFQFKYVSVIRFMYSR